MLEEKIASREGSRTKQFCEAIKHILLYPHMKIIVLTFKIGIFAKNNNNNKCLISEMVALSLTIATLKVRQKQATIY